MSVHNVYAYACLGTYTTQYGSNTMNLTSPLFNNLLQTMYTQRKGTLQAVTMDPGIVLVTTDSNLSKTLD